MDDRVSQNVFVAILSRKMNARLDAFNPRQSFPLYFYISGKKLVTIKCLLGQILGF